MVSLAIYTSYSVTKFITTFDNVASYIDVQANLNTNLSGISLAIYIIQTIYCHEVTQVYSYMYSLEEQLRIGV